MTRIRIPHQYHESNIHTPAIMCRKCNIEKSRTCELWVYVHPAIKKAEKKTIRDNNRNIMNKNI